MTSTEITHVPFVRRDLSVEVSKSFIEHRDDAVMVASLCEAILTPTQNEVATEILRELGQLRRAAEKAHKEIKSPVIACGRALDAALRSAIEPIEAQETRLQRVCGDYVMAQEAKARAAAAAEEARRQGEINALQEKLAQAETIEQREQIREEAAIAVAVAPVVAPTPVRAEGQSVREVWDIKYDDILALAAWALKSNLPHLIDIKPRVTAITALLDKGVVIPGITAVKVNKVQVR